MGGILVWYRQIKLNDDLNYLYEKNFLTFLITAALFFLIGFLSCYFVFESKKGEMQIAGGGNDNFQAGWNAAKEDLIKKGVMQPGEGEVVKEVMGKIELIKGDSVTLKINALEPLSDPDLDIRNISINNDTKIYQIIKKDNKEYQEDLKQFQEELANSKDTSGQQPGPSEYKTAEINKTDLKVGSGVDC